MGKLMNYLQKQLQTELKKDAEDCLKIYDKLKELNDGSVWDTQWRILVDVKFKGFRAMTEHINQANLVTSF